MAREANKCLAHHNGRCEDTPDMIAMCLNCEKAECDNCLYKFGKSKTKKRQSTLDKEKLILDAYPRCRSDHEIAIRTGLSKSTVAIARGRLNLPGPGRRKEDVKWELARQCLAGL